MPEQKISEEHLQQLIIARQALESSSIAMQVANMVGTPIEKGIELLPGDWQDSILRITRDALDKAADVAIRTISPATPYPTQDVLHKLAVSVSGAAGGAFGLPALAIELPVSTTIMLRSIADIAKGEGEDIRMPDSRLACIEVFALGGRTSSDDAVESGYYAVRAALAKAVTEAAKYLAKGGATTAAPAMVSFIARIAARFQIQVTEKAAAQALPVLGAAGGALINNIFMSHFQTMARAHFTVRRLERTYSPHLVKTEYNVER